MKLIRCIVHSHLLDRVMAAVEAIEPSWSLDVTVTQSGGWRPHQRPAQFVYRGREYESRSLPESIIDVTTPDATVDEIVRTIADACSRGAEGQDSRILVLPIEESHRITARPQQIA